MNWVTICYLNDIQPGFAIHVEHNGRPLTVVRDRVDEGKAYIYNDACPHAGASMAGGEANSDHCFVCPLHKWEFDLDTGRCPDNDDIVWPSHPTRVTEAGEIQLGK